MLALWIILVVLAVLALICCLSAVIYVDIGESTRIQAGIAGLRFTLVDTREESPRQKVKALKRQQKQQAKQAEKEAKKKKKARKKQAKAQKKKGEAARAKGRSSAQTGSASKAGSSSKQSKAVSKQSEKEDGFTATVKEIIALIRRCFPNAKYLLRHLRFRRVVIAVNVGAEDANTTAIRYGQVQAGVNTTLGLLAGYGADIQLQAVCIKPDFITGEFRQWISFRVKLRLGVIIVGGVGILGKVIGYFLADSRPDSPPSHPSNPQPQTKKTSAGQAVKENAR